MSGEETPAAAGEEEPLDVLVLTGPTACGKSAVGLLLAERLLEGQAEIISVDSMKVYRRMDIGTAKPTAAERARVPHHLIDIREPWEAYTVHDWVADAERAAREIVSRGHTVVMEGGTPLYLKAFLDGLFSLGPDAGPGPDEDLRARLKDEARKSGLAALHTRLARVDPAAAERIHLNDERRIIRALEVFEQSGRPISELQKQFGRRRAHVRARLVALDRPRKELRARIARRVDGMMAAGFVDEVKALVEFERETGKPVSKPASGALGYRQIREHLLGRATLDEARDEIVRETARFVRKQLTWLRSFDDLVWVAASDDPGRDAERVAGAWSGAATRAARPGSPRAGK